jgi:hypothetical protein
MSASALSRSLSGAGYLFTSSLLQKAVSFVLTQLVQDKVDSKDFGFAEIQMGLFLTTALFLSREGPRLTALRAPLGLFGGAASRGGSRAQQLQQLQLQLQQRRQLANLAWLPVPCAFTVLALSMLLRGWFLVGADGISGAGHAVAVYFWVVALEALAEPAYILSSSMLRFGERAGIEAAAALAQSLTVYFLVAYTALRDRGALAIALGYLVSAAVKLLGFWATLLQWGSPADPGQNGWPEAGLQKFMPSWLPGGLGAQFGLPQLALLKSFFLQGLLKHALTQADKLVLQSGCTQEQKGIYSKVENLGSLAPRIIFFPVEETLRGLVSKLLPQGRPMEGEGGAAANGGAPAAALSAGALAPAASSGGGGKRKRSASAGVAIHPSSSIGPSSARPLLPPTPLLHPASRPNLALGASVLASVLHLVLLVGLLIAGLGFTFSPLVLELRSRDRETLAPLLSLYCVYVLALAVNGVTEAFATAAADPTRLATASLHLTAIVALGAVLMLKLVPLYGLRAMIAINSLGMLLRSASSLGYIYSLLRAQGLQPSLYLYSALPSSLLTLPFLGACVALGLAWMAAAACRPESDPCGGLLSPLLALALPQGLAGSLLVKLAGAGGVGLLAVGGVWVFEGARLLEGWRLLRGGKQQ